MDGCNGKIWSLGLCLGGPCWCLMGDFTDGAVRVCFKDMLVRSFQSGEAQKSDQRNQSNGTAELLHALGIP